MVLKEPGISVSGVSVKLGEIMKTFKTLPRVVRASIGEYAGLYGGLVLLNKMDK